MLLSKSLNIQISATTDGYVQRALQSLHGIDGQDCGAYGHLIQHCTVHRLVRQAKQLHARLILFSVTPGNFLASKLINFYSKNNNIKYARKVFDQISRPNVFSWNAMLIGYCINNMHADTLELFSAMVSLCSDQAKPDNFTVTFVLNALGALLSGSKLAKEVHCFVPRRGFESDVFVGNSLITYYSRCDEVGLARALFDRMPERDVVSWNSMIAGYSQAGYYDECKELYWMMLGLEKFKPVGLIVVSVLQACLQSNELMLGMAVHQFVNENQIEMDVLLCNALIGLYANYLMR